MKNPLLLPIVVLILFPKKIAQRIWEQPMKPGQEVIAKWCKGGIFMVKSMLHLASVRVRVRQNVEVVEGLGDELVLERKRDILIKKEECKRAFRISLCYIGGDRIRALRSTRDLEYFLAVSLDLGSVELNFNFCLKSTGELVAWAGL